MRKILTLLFCLILFTQGCGTTKKVINTVGGACKTAGLATSRAVTTAGSKTKDVFTESDEAPTTRSADEVKDD